MSHSIYGRNKMENGYFDDTRINIAENGWESGRWYPPNQVMYVEPSVEQPERSH